MRKLISITALYLCDNGHILKVTTTHDHPEIDDLQGYFDMVTGGYDELWNDAVTWSKDQKLLDSFFAKLRKMGKRKQKRFGLVNTVDLLGVIYVMEKYGYIRTNENNGIKLEYAPLN